MVGRTMAGKTTVGKIMVGKDGGVGTDGLEEAYHSQWSHKNNPSLLSQNSNRMWRKLLPNRKASNSNSNHLRRIRWSQTNRKWNRRSRKPEKNRIMLKNLFHLQFVFESILRRSVLYFKKNSLLLKRKCNNFKVYHFVYKWNLWLKSN